MLKKYMVFSLVAIGLLFPDLAFSRDILLGEISFTNGTPARLHLTDERNKFCPAPGPWFVARAVTASGKDSAADPLCWTVGERDQWILSDAATGQSFPVLAGLSPDISYEDEQKFLYGPMQRAMRNQVTRAFKDMQSPGGALAP